MSGKIDLEKTPERVGSRYPAPFQANNSGKARRALGDVGGLTQFGVNLLRLPAGQWSAERHWHSNEDEFVWVLSGEVVLVSDDGETVMCAGDCAAFPSGEPNGHHLQNRSDAEAVLLEVGSRRPGPDYAATYPDIDLMIALGKPGFRHKDGTPWS